MRSTRCFRVLFPCTIFGPGKCAWLLYNTLCKPRVLIGLSLRLKYRHINNVMSKKSERNVQTQISSIVSVYSNNSRGTSKDDGNRSLASLANRLWLIPRVFCQVLTSSVCYQSTLALPKWNLFVNNVGSPGMTDYPHLKRHTP